MSRKLATAVAGAVVFVAAMLAPGSAFAVKKEPELIAYSDALNGIYTFQAAPLLTLLIFPAQSQGRVYPEWAPGGQLLAFPYFYGADGSRPREFGLKITNRRGHVVKTLLKGQGVQGPSWSPDLSQISYSCAQQQNHYGLCIVNVATGQTRTLVDPNGPNSSIGESATSWSPKGDRILWGYPDIKSVDATTGAISQFARGVGPAFSPDGSKIVYIDAQNGISVLNTDGSGGHQIVPPNHVMVAEHNTAISHPTFSPDSKDVLFGTGTDGAFRGNVDLFRVKADGSGPFKQITQTPDDDISPTWAPAVPACTIMGTFGNDKLKGTKHDDVICALTGNDKVDGKGGNDVIFGGDGNDTLIGGPGKDELYGEAGNDILKAKDGVKNEKVDGGPGKDKCTADNGDHLTSC